MRFVRGDDEAAIVAHDLLIERGEPKLAKKFADEIAFMINRPSWVGDPRKRRLEIVKYVLVSLGGEKRVQRVYAWGRRHGKNPAEAFRSAKPHRSFRIIGHVGDINWPNREGGPVYLTPEGASFEYIIFNERKRRPRWYVYRVDIPREPISGESWIDVNDVAESRCTNPGSLRKQWRSKNPLARAQARVDVAGYYGWENLDSYPLTLTRKELQERYRKRVDKP